MTHFRPCIDLHHGQVKQIVGGSLTDDGKGLQTNFVAFHSAEWYATRYCEDSLKGGHIIKLGPGNDEAALAALTAYPGGMQIGGGITLDNANRWLDAGASHVIVTSILFDRNGQFQPNVLSRLVEQVGEQRLVLDLSCRRTRHGWTVAMNRWQTLTSLPVTPETLNALAGFCAEFLIHAADVEGKCRGIDRDLVSLLGSWRGRPMTYAGGISRMEDFELIDELSQGSIDATVGSALDLFGGSGVRYDELLSRRLP